MGVHLFKYKDFMDESKIPFNFNRHQKPLTQVLHMHDYFQIAYVMRGVCTHIYGNQTLTVSKGDIFIIPPWVEHCLSSIDNKDYELILLDFIPMFVDGQFKSFSQSIYHQLLHHKDAQSPLEQSQPWLHIAHDKQQLVEQLLHDIADEFDNREEGYQFSIQINLVKLLILIDREFRRNSRMKLQSAMDQRPHQQQMDEVIRYINHHYNQDISLEQGAYIAHMAPAYFSHLFKKETGKSFIEFLHEVRIERAMDLIRQNYHSVTHICYLIGFHNLSHFIRTFKKRTGLTPTEFKKTLLQSEK